MQIEFSVSDARAKRRVQAMVRDLGHRTQSGPVRLAAPFTVIVDGVAEHDLQTLWSVVRGVDPGAARVGVPARQTAAVALRERVPA